MRRAALTSALLVALGGSAEATGSIGCEADGDAASLELTIGTLPVLSVVGATIAAGGTTLSTEEDAPNRIVTGQAFADEEKVLIDFTDPNIEDILASVRLFRSAEGDDFAMAGTLTIAGTGAFAVTCVGP